jgi:hypothetical protein
MPNRVQEGVNSTGPSASKHTLFEAISVSATADRFGSATASRRLPGKRTQLPGGGEDWALAFGIFLYMRTARHIGDAGHEGL